MPSSSPPARGSSPVLAGGHVGGADDGVEAEARPGGLADADVGELAVVCLRPQLLVALDVHQLCDDAHAIARAPARQIAPDVGVLGGGRGTAAHFGITKDVDLIMSTFSKSFASLGGFIAGDEDVIHYIKHHARSLIFSASIPAANAAASLAALQIMKEEPERIARLEQIGIRMRTEYNRLGFNTGQSQSPIIPIIIGGDMPTIYAWHSLFEKGVFVNPVISPGVAAGQELLRTSYMATHTDEQLNQVLEIFEQVGKQLGLI